MIRLKNKWIVIGISITVLMLIVYSFTLQTVNQPTYTYKKYCGNCHLLPSPQDLPKHIWRDKVLPEMAARLGYKFNPEGYKPRQFSMEEEFELRMANIYPEKPLLTKREWDDLYNYIMTQAPDSLSSPKYSQRTKPLTLFKPVPDKLDDRDGALTTYLRFATDEKKLFVGNAFGKVYSWEHSKSKFELLDAAQTPIMEYTQQEDKTFLTEVGIMTPSDLSVGRVWENGPKGKRMIAEKLRRPVFSQWIDLNKDNEPEMLVGEFGNDMGELSMWKRNSKGYYQKTTLLNLPGVIRVIPNDLNQDGLTDLIVLASQAREGVYVLYNSGNFNFAFKNLIQLKPHYGISWFELVDFDQDKDLDIILVNGDNADFSPILKPYHGLRIYLNDGKNQFKESFFYPIYGATRIIAKDFDQDNDIDLAITSYFPDFERNIQESFIYLESLNPKKFEFQSYTFEQADQGRWMVMESGDFDQDGDEDIVLGSFDMVSGSGKLKEKWQKGNVDLLWLKNQLKNKTIQ